LITARYIYLTIKAASALSQYTPGCLYSEDPSNPCIIGDIPAPGSAEEKRLIMESLLEIPGIFDA
jgi:hypothetical protein